MFCGVTGTIQFNRPDNGDRKDSPSALMKVVESKEKNSQYDYVFEPLGEVEKN